MSKPTTLTAKGWMPKNYFAMRRLYEGSGEGHQIGIYRYRGREDEWEEASWPPVPVTVTVVVRDTAEE